MKTHSAIKTAGNVRWKSQIQNRTIGKTPEESPRPISGGVYVHVPFCRHKCPYCHFYVLPYKEDSVQTYLDTLVLEWDLRKSHLDEIQTLYIGGGTPSLLTPKQLERILTLFPNVAGEITIEANPEDVTFEKMSAYRALGVNRVSIGVQTLDENLLQIIERRHSSNKAVEAVETTHRAGFENITIDLMYDLPNQTRDDFKRSLRIASKLPINHLSLYNLTFEKGSKYFQEQDHLRPSLPSDEESLHMIEDACEILEEAGLIRYEISAFARESKQAEHNLSYWVGRPFIGLGPSAFSYTYGSRHQNASHIKRWQASVEKGEDPTTFSEMLPYPANLLELFAVRLRLLEGADLDDFPPLPKETIETLNQLTDDGLLQRDKKRYALTNQGTLFYDTVAASIIA